MDPSPEEKTYEKRIVLWPGKRRDEGDNHPYLTGKVTVDGVEYFVDLWKRKRRSTQQPLISGQLTRIETEELE
jgi:hypothetical protein